MKTQELYASTLDHSDFDYMTPIEKRQFIANLDKGETISINILSAFDWDDSPEGDDYWHTVMTRIDNQRHIGCTPKEAP